MNGYFFLVFLLFLIPFPAFADDGEDVIENLGWVSIGTGVIATVPFIAFIKVRKFAVSAGESTVQLARQMAPSYKPILNFHIILNSIGYFSGMFHGLMLSNNLEPISLSLALVMTVLMISGVLLRYTSSKNAKMFNKLLHGQFGLVILLISLILLHILTAND